MDFLKKLAIQPINPGAYAGNDWVSNNRQATFKSINPANNQLIAEVYSSNQQDYEQIIKHSQVAFQQWRQTPAPQRGELIRQIADALRNNKDALGSLVSLEAGKSKAEGDGEVQEMIDIADFAVGQSRMLYGKTMHSERSQHRLYEQWHPYGIVGVISAFNFPVAVWSWNAFIAAICGNVTVWKPSTKTPLCAIAVQNICNQVLKKNNCPPIFNLFIPQDNAVAESLVLDPHVPLVSFTGSTKTGRVIAEKVSHRLGRTILELGGNNATIIDETADLKQAVPAIVFAAIGTAGQRCTSARRLIIHQSIYPQLLERLLDAYRQINIGDPLDKRNQMGPLIDQQAVKSYQDALKLIKSQGGKIEFGGKVLAQDGFYVEPTIVTGVENHWDIVQEETFAPILYLMVYTEFEQAIALNNSVRQGLSSALFTTNLRHAERYLSAQGSDCGIANVNTATSGAEIGGAFGGEKETGGGRESGSDSWKAYMRRQTNVINWGTQMPLAQDIKFV